MGEEIARSSFEPEEFARFEQALAAETALLRDWFAQGVFADRPLSWGFELEAWLLDHNYFPLPVNEALLQAIANPLVVPELSRFNIEFNIPPQPFGAQALSAAETELTRLWQHSNDVAHRMDTNLVMIGTLPTIREQDLSLANISPLKRYYALNNEVLRQRGGAPIRIDIKGRERLRTVHEDVMLEAATTSFQVHFKVPASRAHDYYNASLALSGPILSCCANAPLLFDRVLWEETRIPLFEQAVNLGSGRCRVDFGSRLLEHSLYETFAENLASFPALLPIAFEEPAESLRHLRLHNGTIWRWNRPLIGFEASGQPHLRIEHRVQPAGPTIADMIANAALYLGLVHYWVEQELVARLPISIEQSQANFYAAARLGLQARQKLGSHRGTAATILRDLLLPQADTGLQRLGIGAGDRARYLGLIEQRARIGQTGAAWQRRHYLTHGRDAFRTMAAYCERQRSGAPVHEWD